MLLSVAFSSGGEGQWCQWSGQSGHHTPKEVAWQHDIMPDQVGDQGEVHTSVVELVLVEAVAAHRLRLKVGRLLGIENRHQQIAFEATRFGDRLSDGQTDRDRRAIVVSTGSIDHTIVVGTYDQRRQLTITPRNDPNEIREPHATHGVRQLERVSRVGGAADFSKPPVEKLSRNSMPRRSHHPPLRKTMVVDIGSQLLRKCGVLQHYHLAVRISFRKAWKCANHALH